MGTQSTVTGSIIITPPLTAQEMRDKSILTRPNPSRCVFVQTNEQSKDVPEGTLTVITGVAILPCHREMNAQGIEDEIIRIAGAFPGHQFQGNIHGFTESGDHWRVRAWHNGDEGAQGLRYEEAAPLWPDQRALLEFVIFNTTEDIQVAAGPQRQIKAKRDEAIGLLRNLNTE